MLSSKLAKAGPSFTRSVSSAVPPAAVPALFVTAKSKRKAAEIPETPVIEKEDPWSSLFDTVSAKAPANTLYPTIWNKRGRLPSNFFTSGMGKRKYSTRAGEGYPSRPSPTTESSTWDHIFDTVSPTPPQNTNSHRGRPLGPPPAKVSQALANRSKMSKSELDAFNDMFNMIFDALGDKSTTPAPPATSAGIGGTLSRMRGHALRRTADLTLDGNKDKAQMELDKDIEEIELCESDYEVMQWTLRRLLNNADLPHPIRGPGCLRHIIRLLNTKFQNPHLALALFQYAREANTAAYVVLCTAPVYGELIHIQWSAFRDLGAVRATLEEMIANAVDPDGFVTRSILAIGRELAERDGTAGVIVDGRMCGTGIDEREVWATVERCEAIVRSTQDGRKEPGNWRKEVQKLEWDLKGEDETRHFRDMVRPADEEPISYPNPGFT